TATLPYFDIQASLNTYLNNPRVTIDLYIPHLHKLLTHTSLETPVAWFLGSTSDIQNLLKKALPAEMDSRAIYYLRGVQALSKRNYADATEFFRHAEELSDRG